MTQPFAHRPRPIQVYQPNRGPKIKGVTELQSSAAMQDYRARNSLYGDIPTADQVKAQVERENAAKKMMAQSQLSQQYEAYRRAQGAGAAAPVVPGDPAEKRRKNLIAGGAQPMEAAKIIADEAKVAAAKPAAPAAPAGLGPSQIPLKTAPAFPSPALPSPVGSPAISAATAPVQQSAPQAPPSAATVTDNGVTSPMRQWIDENKKRQKDAGIGTGSGTAVGVAAKGGRDDQRQPVLAGEEGSEVKINDDESVEAINQPTMLSRKQGGAVIPHHELRRLKKKYDKKPIAKCKAAMGGRLTSADTLIGNANAAAPVGIGGTTTVPGPTPPQASTGAGQTQAVRFGPVAGQPSMPVEPSNRIPTRWKV